MNTTNLYFHKSIKHNLLLVITLLLSFSVFAQITPDPTVENDSVKTGFSFSNIEMPNPNSITSMYTYDPETDRYVYTESVGNFNINYPIILTPKEYQDLIFKENLKNYYQEKIDATDGKKDTSEEAKKNLLPEFYVNSGFFETIFGGNTIEVVPQGSLEMDLGVLFTKQDNPSFSPRNRSNFTFDFDQRISLSLLGKVGERLQVTANYDTEASFDFQQLVKLEYDPTFGGGEDSILQKLEIGNVSMPLNSSLISGAQSLFGVKTKLQFGKTSVTAVFSEQKSDTRSVVAQGGGTLDEFDFFIRDYDENRHFFLAQYFRNNYDKALANYPFINTNVQITRAEVWITNRSNRTENVRNIVALQDIGESEIIGNAGVVVTAGPGAFPDNANNRLDPTNIGGPGSQITNAIRDIATVQAGILIPGFNEGFDYAKLENTRKLVEGQEYTINTQLGYISLNQRLNNDEVLAVAFQYTVGGQVYQVGEFANDGIGATDVETNSNGDVTSVTNNNLILKLLKSSITSVSQPIWDLMMKNIYDTGAYQLSQEDFKLNIFYNESAPLNFITAAEGSGGFGTDFEGEPIDQTTLLRLFNLDRLNYNNDPQTNGDGFFDFVSGITVIPENGKIVFTKVEPFGRYLFDVLDNDGNPGNNVTDYEADTYTNLNQEKYVYDLLYKGTKTAALDEVEKNKFQLKGRYKSSGGDGIAIGGFNVPRGSVKVTAGGRVLVEGVDYTVNYQLGRVQILDEALKASNTPIQVTTENNSIFGQQTKRYTGLNVEHQFNENFLIGATYINLNERPITQKANYNSEPINNTILGFNGNYSTEVPFFTRLVNKLPNVDTDAPSNLSVRGEFAYLLPGAPKGTDLNGEATAYIDDFEGSQNGIDLKSAQSWFLSSRPLEINGTTAADAFSGIRNGYDRALLNWYTIDPIFYSGQRPSGIDDDDISNLYTSRVFVQELFPQQDIAQGQTTVLNTLDLTYYPTERGPYNFSDTNIEPDGNTISTPTNAWAGITRQLTSTDFEQSNVEYIEFWMQDPFQDNPTNPGGKLFFNLGSISEDVLKDGKKQYENGLPTDGNVSLLQSDITPWAIPQNQALIYAFDSTGGERTNQDVGYDGYDDLEEKNITDPTINPNNPTPIPSNISALPDPSADNYQYYLSAEGDILQRYKKYNNVQGNSPDSFSDTNRGSTTQPDVEDINRDNTMNTIDSYFEYELEITRQNLPLNSTNEITAANPIGEFIKDVKIRNRSLPNGETEQVRWYQFRVPVEGEHVVARNGITDLRSIRFARIYLNGFSEQTTFRFGTLDLVRSDWRRYQLALDGGATPSDFDDTEFTVGVVSTQENEGSYESPPGIVPERLNNNNTIIDQNEQSLVVNVCELKPKDARAVYKNISVDMRQYKRLRMFMHAEEGEIPGLLGDKDLIGFIRMGNDLTQNYYQIEVPLKVSTGTTSAALWPTENEINLPLDLLEQIKSLGIANGTLANDNPTFYDVINGVPVEIPFSSQFDGYELGQTRLAIKGNPNFGDVRTLMVGVKNGSTIEQCGEVWFNELRLSDMDNEGGWAAIMSVDSNFADFANVSATGRMSTAGFGSVDQGPQERSREEVKQYDVVTNVNIGQLLPKKWGIQLPFNYGQGVELITPEYDQQYKDLKLQNRIDAAETTEEKDAIREQSEEYTKRRSINFIGVRKVRTGESKPRFYDVENLTFNHSYNKVEHRDFEIERSIDKQARTGASYAYNFEPKIFEPFKKNDSIFTNKYWKLLKDFNLNLLPASFTVNTDINRQFNRQRFRDVELGGNNIGLEELVRRNYNFDFQSTVNWNLTKSLSLNFAVANNNIVRNYFKDNIINGEQDPSRDVWDGYFDVGDANRRSQTLGINYEIPFNKFPALDFISATYSYQGLYQWQKGSDLFGDLVADDGLTYDLGNSISNGNTHNINSTLDMRKFYKYLGIKKKRVVKNSNKVSRVSGATPPGTVKKEEAKKPEAKKSSGVGTEIANFGIGLLTSIKRIQANYSENNGTFLPGFLDTPGFISTSKPTFGYTLGSQSDIRDIAARNGWLTVFPDFNQQYTKNHTKQLDLSANLEPINDLKIDLVASRTYAENYSENYRIEDNQYISLTPNVFGNFNISTFTLPTAFGKSDDISSEAFDAFRENRLTIARRLAAQNGANVNDVDADGFPLGYGKTSQAVLLPAFLSAYTGQNAEKTKLGAFRNIPIPNWDIKYTGLMKFNWFKKRFKRLSLSHGYRSSYTINQFRTNLDFNGVDYSLPYASQPADDIDQAGNFKNAELYSNINLTELFSPLIKIDMEMKNSVIVGTEIRKDRLLSLSFDNNLMTEIQGNEYAIKLGYRFKDVRIKTKLAGPKKSIVSDLIMEANLSVRDNKTIVRYLDLENNQITNGQTIYGLKYNANYSFSKNLTGIFYFDYTFSEYAISTAFPQTTIRSGITLRYNFGN
ncbi:protein involved in gliding motility SprA [Lacinutrix venerupis]|uniref:T9SS outer membrane translocon Sov/SprA n=1 Tax=Lacinutrix venerupis TaxID=1486034 RepID=UPI000EADC767|nr:cell surface protein SprA [Lacinutrix venerupis]RLJ65719.1 protein involved in gliding motility SprA [Lacinutrix venerupis]